MKGSAQILHLYRRLFGRKIFHKINSGLFFLSLKGLGIGNWETPELSGEKDFVTRFAGHVPEPTVIDIGANVGNYSCLLKSLSPAARIFAFEPHPLTFKRLKESAASNNFTAVNAACGSERSVAKLYDHRTDGDLGTEHASMFQDVIEGVHADASKSWDITVTTLDSFVEENDIRHIDLLKIDVEGGEMNVLLGARKSLDKKMIDFIHFEFTEANTVSRVFMRDFYNVLSDFEFFRMVSDGLVPMGPYHPPFSEIFAYQNVVAVRKGVRGWS